jgi:hypothetical protein
MKSTIYSSLFAALALVVTAEQTLEAQTPANASITIGTITYSGTGCPQNSVSSILSDDKTLVTFGFDSFQATIGPSSPPGDSRKNCNIVLQLLFQNGFQLAIAETVYHGYTRLDDGVNAKFTTEYDYKFSATPGKKVSPLNFNFSLLLTDQSAQGHTETSLDGEKETAEEANDRKGGRAHKRRNKKEFKTRHPHKAEKTAWSKCGKDAHMIVENALVLTTRNKTATGEFAVDDETVKFRQKLSLKWMKCK